MKKLLLEREATFNKNDLNPWRLYFLLDWDGNPIDENGHLVESAVIELTKNYLCCNNECTNGTVKWSVIYEGEEAETWYKYYTDTLDRMMTLTQHGIFVL